ncbi:MAG: flagellar hook-associated protein FlgK [Alkaliphilus sp.]|nr:flagellar hook-associated protein FlgK [Alkaliphilus sp.]
MSGTFFGFNIARSGLFASQRALHVTGHNIANANTPGFSRQRLEIVQSNPMNMTGGQGMLGSGVDTQSISNIRDQFLDFKFRGENQAFGEWNARTEVLGTIESIMNEPSDSGIRTAMDEFFSSLQELSTKPEDLTVRALVRERGIALAKTVNHMGAQLEKLQKDLDFQIKTVVGEINGYADQLADLNNQIFKFELGGNKANDLRDQRNLVLDKLSKHINIDSFEDSQGRMQVLVQGKQLVSHIKAHHLETKMRLQGAKLNQSDVENLSDVVWADGSSFSVNGGSLKGFLDMRDGLRENAKGVPYYMEQLNHFSKTFAVQFNMLHRDGHGMNGAKGIDFFEMDKRQIFDITSEVRSIMTGPPALSEAEAIKSLERLGGNSLEAKLGLGINYDSISIVKFTQNGQQKYYLAPKITATTLKISSAVDSDLNAIAASRTFAGLPGDGGNALRLNQLKNDGNMFDWGKPEDFMKSLISNLGVDSQQAIRISGNQELLLDQIDTRRQSASGVSLDEEMSNMVRFQHSYNANARMITTIDEMIDVLINRMGLVGR